MSDRFYAPVPFDVPVVELSREESQHLAGVLRKSPGDPVTVFDGRGRSAEAIVETAGKRTCTLRIARQLPIEAPRTPQIELATAAPKGDRARWLIEKATELGADRWTPLQLTRSVVDPGDGKLERLRQTVIAACKQCGRNRLLEIGAPRHWTEWLAESTRSGAVLIAHPSGAPLPDSFRAVAADGPEATALAIAIGPEGGFTDAEIDAGVTAGARLVSLGPHLLRIETAAIAALAALRLSAHSMQYP